MDNKIIDKIQKLLALSESSNEYEAQASMLKAQQLLAKHKLTLRQVEEFKEYSSDIQERKTKITFTKAKWKANLAGLIADNFGCYCFLRTRNTNTITFFGREEDVIVCNIVLEYAIDCINSAVKKLRYKYLRNRYSTKGLENDYAMGFISGLEKKFEEQRKSNEEWGLILIKDSQVIQAYEEKTNQFKGTVNTRISFKGYRDVFGKGFKDGGEFSISDKITN